MFERFTDRARQTVVLAQEEARRLQHNYIGTEHILLGLLAVPDGVAGQALARVGLTLDAGREDVLAIIGLGKHAPTGHIPFTPRAKKTLELALREALQLGHNYIGTEHILLGLVREGEGVAAQIMLNRVGDLAVVREAVLDVIPTLTQPAGQGGVRWLRRRSGDVIAASVRPRRQDPQGEMRTTPAADASLAEAARLAGSGPVGSHHMLLAALADPESAAARTLVFLGLDLDLARQTLRAADVTGSTDELPEDAGRRQMLIRVSDDRLTIEAADQAIVSLGRSALDALSGSAAGAAGGPGAAGGAGETAERGASGADVIRGDQPISAGLAAVWLSLHDALEDIRRRAVVAGQAERVSTAEPPAPKADPGQQAGAGG